MTIEESSAFPTVVIYVHERDLVNIAGLPISARNILTAKIGGCRNIVVATTDPSLKDVITAALHRTTISISPTWMDANDIAEALASQETVIYIDSGVLVNPDLIRSAAQLALAKHHEVITLLNQAGDVVAWCGSGNGLPSDGDDGRIKFPKDVGEHHEYAPTDSSFHIDGTEEIADAERWIFRNLEKTTDGFVSRRLNRPVSTRISRYLARTSLKPIHLTGLTALSALATFFTLLMGGSVNIVIGCILFHATSVIDGFDGEIARAKFLATPFGATLDTAVDMLGNILFFAGLTIALYVEYGTPYHLLGIYIVLAAITSIVSLSIVLRLGPGGGSFDTLAIAIQTRLQRWPKTARIVSAVERLFKRDSFAFATAVVAVMGMAHVIPWFLAGGMTLWFLAILMNARYILHANPEDITPKHIQESQQ